MKSDPLPDTKTNDLQEPDWKQLCSDLQRERDALRSRLKEVEADRDAYRKTVEFLMAKDLGPLNCSPEEILEQAKGEPATLELISRLEGR